MLSNKALKDLTALNKEIKLIKKHKLVDDERLDELLFKHEQKLFAIEEEVNKIDDPIIRLIIRLRYVKGYTWSKTAIELGYSAESSPRNALNRFLKRLN